MFDRLQPSSSIRRPYVFSTIRTQPKPSVFNRIKKGIEPLKAPSQKLQSSVFNRLGDINEVQTSIPSRMKRFSTLDVKTKGSLRMKRRTVIFAGQQTNSDSNREEG